MDYLDNQFDGQLSIDDLFKPPFNRLLAVSKIFARARKELSLAEQKTFVYALSEMKFTEAAKTNVVRLDKKELADILGIHSDPDHLSVDLFDNIKNMTAHSHIEIRERDLDLYASGFLITSVVSFKNFVRIRFNEDYLPLFTGLSGNYITLWSGDIFQMTSRRSVQFYEFLRNSTNPEHLVDVRTGIYSVAVGIKFLKSEFGIPKDGKGSYMRKDGHFDRPAFEKYVIDPLCRDLAKSKMITLVMAPDGKAYEKVKRGARVDGYRFFWAYSAHPAVAAAEEVHELQERVDKDPQILKAAKDIITGDKRAKRGEKKNAFNAGVQNHDYDWPAFEEELLSAQDQQLPGQASIEDYPDFMP